MATSTASRTSVVFTFRAARNSEKDSPDPHKAGASVDRHRSSSRRARTAAALREMAREVHALAVSKRRLRGKVVEQCVPTGFRACWRYRPRGLSAAPPQSARPLHVERQRSTCPPLGSYPAPQCSPLETPARASSRMTGSWQTRQPRLGGFAWRARDPITDHINASGVRKAEELD